MEKKRRSVVKSATYRVIALIVLLAITWYVTGNLVQTTFISVTFQLVQLVTYYVHERPWERISWGKMN